MGVLKTIAKTNAKYDDLKELYQALKQSLETEKTRIPSDPDTLSTLQGIIKKVQVAVNASYGVLLGHMNEVAAANKHRLKGRLVILQKHADVSVGNSEDSFAKSTQLKNCTTTKQGDVDTHIKKAANQISGGKKETPRDEDRRIIDISISHPLNPWPLDKQAKTPHDFAELVSEAEVRILKCMNEGLTLGGQGWLGDVLPNDKLGPSEDVVIASIINGYKNTSKLKKFSYSALNGYKKLGGFNSIQAKIRFFPPRKISIFDKNNQDSLEMAVFSVFRLLGNVVCKNTAYKLSSQNKTDYFALSVKELREELQEKDSDSDSDSEPD
jgi:hypothetical protein